MGATVSCEHGGTIGGRYDRNYIVGEWTRYNYAFYYDGREIAIDGSSLFCYTKDGDWDGGSIPTASPFHYMRFYSDGTAVSPYHYEGLIRWGFENGKTTLYSFEGESLGSLYFSDDGCLCMEVITFEVLGYFFSNDDYYDVHYPEDISTLSGYDGNIHELTGVMIFKKTGN